MYVQEMAVEDILRLLWSYELIYEIDEQPYIEWAK